MGWNHWYAHYNRVTDAMMRQARRCHGSQRHGRCRLSVREYRRLLDEFLGEADRSAPFGPLRDERGSILPNKHFPDMKALTDYIHARGLKAGIYTSPDIRPALVSRAVISTKSRNARHLPSGVSTSQVRLVHLQRGGPGDKSLANLKKPYLLMGDILNDCLGCDFQPVPVRDGECLGVGRRGRRALLENRRRSGL